jgi:nitrate reductase assembly molybdenum cofactor insertion protein NarJ
MILDDTTDALLVESARWRLLGLLFERPRTGWHAEVRALASEVRNERLNAAARTTRNVDEGSYLAVLGPGGTVSPREVAYRRMGDPGKILAGLHAMYEAFGFEPKAEDPPDHVAVQAGFVGFMKLKQAYAAAGNDEAGERMTREAIATFTTEHLGGFVGEMAQRLEDAALEHLARAAAILGELCPAAPTSRVPLRVLGRQGSGVPDDDDDGLACDAGWAG